jgi:hypothetical protein
MNDTGRGATTERMFVTDDRDTATTGTFVDRAKAVNQWRRAKILEARLARLRSRNARSTAPITGSAPVVVCMTTHGKRIENAFYAIESIAAGSVRPERVMLWVDDLADVADAPDTLRRLVARGLEIGISPNYGPHTKYYPYVASVAEHQTPLVTADDDIMYPTHWLAALLAAAPAQDILEVVCHRARTIRIVDGQVGPYVDWAITDHSRPSHLTFATGVGGVRYPTALLNILHEAGDEFMGLCPRADDVWLHAIALRNGYRARQLRPTPYPLVVLPYDKDVALWPTNINSGGNDQATAATYTPEDVKILVEETTGSADRSG